MRFIISFISLILPSFAQLIPHHKSLSAAKQNAAIIQANIKNKSRFVIPKSIYYIYPVEIQNIHDAILEIDAKLIAYPNIKYWPKDNNSSSYKDIFRLSHSNNFTIKGSGSIDGMGAIWWKDVLEHRQHEPHKTR